MAKKITYKTKPIHPLQSAEWSNFRKAWGNEVLLTKYGAVTIHPIPFTSFSVGMFLKGPLPSKKLLQDLEKIGKEKKLIFIKLEPNVGWQVPISKNEQQERMELTKLLTTNGCVKGKNLFTPTTFSIDLLPSEEELLKSFSSKTRYNIRLAQRHGVNVKEDNSQKAFEEYIKLTRETVTRQGFYAHGEKYHRLMWHYLRTKNDSTSMAHLLTATYNKEVITTWILFTHQGLLYYPYGASSDKHKNVMANNLMMWEAIKFGKKLGLTKFDLWGREEGKGFTKFKEGFNPKIIEFLGSWDLVIYPKLYRVYRIAETVRWFVLRIKSKLHTSKHGA